MRVENKINNFEAYCYTDGSPNWIKLNYNGEEIIQGLNPKEIQDFIDCLEGLRRKVLNSAANHMIDGSRRAWDL